MDSTSALTTLVTASLHVPPKREWVRHARRVHCNRMSQSRNPFLVTLYEPQQDYFPDRSSFHFRELKGSHTNLTRMPALRL